MFHSVEFVLDFLAGLLGQKAYHDDGNHAEDKARNQFVDLEDFTAKTGEVELPDEGGDAAHQHTGNGCGEGGTLPEEGQENQRSEGCAEATPGEAHETHDHIKEALALLDAVGRRCALESDENCDDSDDGHHNTANPHEFLVGSVLAEDVLVHVVTESGSRNQELGVCSTHDSGENCSHEDRSDCRMAEGLAENHEDTFRVLDGETVGAHIVVTQEADHDHCTEADDNPGHGDAARVLDFISVLDGHETHQNVGHAEVAETPGQARNQGDKADCLAGRSVGEEAHQVGVLCVHCIHGSSKAAAGNADDGGNHENGDEHHGSLDEVCPADCEEAAHEGVAHDHHSTDDKAGGVVQTEDGAEELSGSHEAGHSVEEEEGQDEEGCDYADNALLVAETVGEEVGEGDGVVAEVGVLAETTANNLPVEVSSDHETDTDPSFGETADEDGAGKTHEHPATHIGSLGGHCHHPLVHTTVAQVVGVEAVCLAREVGTDA